MKEGSNQAPEGFILTDAETGETGFWTTEELEAIFYMLGWAGDDIDSTEQDVQDAFVAGFLKGKSCINDAAD